MRRWFPPLLLGVLSACREVPPTSAPAAPRAEFLLVAGDSTYWVRSDSGAVHVRGAPIQLARLAGRFHELYVVDDDYSFQDAVLIGQSVYRRDLLTGDSVRVYADTLVPRLARDYSRAHPDDHRIAPEDETSDEPLWRVTATLDLEEVHGPYVAFSLHTDVERDDAPFWHASRRGTLDLAHGGVVTLADLLPARARGAVERARTRVMQAAFDSVRMPGAGRARAAALRALYRVDPTSFALTTLGGAPAVAYALPGAGPGERGQMLPLPPVAIPEPAWWGEEVRTLPVGSADGRRRVWRRDRYEVVVRDDFPGARLSLRDPTSREWPVARVGTPALAVYWLDEGRTDPRLRGALTRAFDEWVRADDRTRTTALPGTRLLLAAATGAPRRPSPAPAP